MFKHEKTLLHPARCDRPNPNYAQILQENLGGANGEFKAAAQYMTQSFRVVDPAVKDLMLDIAAEELSHMEIIATTINLLNGPELAANETTVGSVEASTLSGLLPTLTNSSGYLWTAAYVNATGDLVADLLSDVAAEQRAKVVYEYLYRQINDGGVRETIEFLLNREEAHNGLFREALNRVKDTGSNRDYGVERHSQQYFDLSTPGRFFDNPNPTPASFSRPDRQQDRPMGAGSYPPAYPGGRDPYRQGERYGKPTGNYTSGHTPGQPGLARFQTWEPQ